MLDLKKEQRNEDETKGLKSQDLLIDEGSGEGGIAGPHSLIQGEGKNHHQEQTLFQSPKDRNTENSSKGLPDEVTDETRRVLKKRLFKK